jgi:multidrug efflux pump subunit AcrA (membrane-fusion protein)
MRKRYFWIIGIVIAGALISGIAVKIYNSSQKKPKAMRSKAKLGIAIPVEIAPVTTKSIRNLHTFTGTLEPWSRYEVAPKIAGRLENISVSAGDPVYNGEMIAKIDDAEYLQEIEKAKAELNIAEAVKGELTTQLNLAKKEFIRAQTMKSNRVISDSAYEAKRSDYLVKMASYKKAQAELNQKQALLNLAKVRFDYTKIYARWSGKKNLIFNITDPGHTPDEIKETIDRLLKSSDLAERYDLKNFTVTQSSPGNFVLEVKLDNQLFDFVPLATGLKTLFTEMKKKSSPDMVIKIQEDSAQRFVGKKYVDTGQMLKANDPIISIINIRRVKAMVNVIEKDYPLLKMGQPAVVTTGAYPDQEFSGKVGKITKILDEYTRQAEVEIEIDNPQLLLRPGMFAKVSIQFATLKNAQTVPRNAVVNFNDVIGVFMLNADRKTVQFVKVKTGLIDNDSIQIISPRLIRPVVTLGNHLLYSGIAVNITSREKVLKESIKKLDTKKNPSNKQHPAEAKQQ